MHDEAVSWAGSVLDDPVVGVAELTGGLTSTMLALTHRTRRRSVLRLMTEEPWRSHGAALTARERAAQVELTATPVPAPVSLGIDADGARCGVAAHLMSRVPGAPRQGIDRAGVDAMVELVMLVHAVRPTEPFREYQSWAWEAKWVVPPWTRHPEVWRRAFDVLAGGPPAFEPVLLHRDFSHRNLLWRDDTICGLVDWVETSSGPAWLDAAHAATNLSVAFGPEPASSFLETYAARTGTDPEPYWLVMDAVGFLPPPGRPPMFGRPSELAGLDDWIGRVLAPR